MGPLSGNVRAAGPPGVAVNRRVKAGGSEDTLLSVSGKHSVMTLPKKLEILREAAWLRMVGEYAGECADTEDDARTVRWLRELRLDLLAEVEELTAKASGE